jgi:hypothetical protein
MIIGFNGFTEQISLYKNVKLTGKTPESERKKTVFILLKKIKYQLIEIKINFDKYI